jgi:hypothetical protein
MHLLACVLVLQGLPGARIMRLKNLGGLHSIVALSIAQQPMHRPH